MNISEKAGAMTDQRAESDRCILLPEVAEHYAAGDESARLFRGSGPLERQRTRDLVSRYLTKAPAKVLDVGGGVGVHAYWLASLGHEVHLIDAMPRHIEQARAGSTEFPGSILASIELGDARQLIHQENITDFVLLFGPLYHLVERRERLLALREAFRVLRPGGVLFAVGVSRFASLLDGLYQEYLDDPDYRQIVSLDLTDGQHRDPTKRGYFTTTFFHHPDELQNEVLEAGFNVLEVVGIDGLGFVVRDFDAWWSEPDRREWLLDASRSIEREPSLLGLSPHIMVVGRK